MLRRLPRTVRLLGAASFLNDAASEMIAPILPVFLSTRLGAGPAVIGLIEGVAEATASILKLAAGRWSDRTGRSRPFVVSGYGISNVARPIMGLAGSWTAVLGLRFLDRVGKGIRTAPRDALISAAVEDGERGRAFGFHRAMDHAGATVGPVAAFLLLDAGTALDRVFLWSAVPGALLLLLLWIGLRRDPPAPSRTVAPWPRWSSLAPRLRALVLAAGVLAFATVPDAFLVLWAHERGLAILWVPLLWAAAHAVRSPVVRLAGGLSDRTGRVPVVVGGWVLRVGALLLLAWADGGTVLTWVVFLLYAGATAVTEGAERALIGDAAPAKDHATVFGVYHLVVGIAALPGALFLGLVWETVGRPEAFVTAAVLTALSVAVLLIRIRPLNPST